MSEAWAGRVRRIARPRPLPHLCRVSFHEPPICRAVIGPTNTGKTHYAVERMLARSSGVIGLPLRLLAREVYDKVVARKGPSQVALMTGEEKIVPRGARYYVCTVEAMPPTLPPTGKGSARRPGEPFAFLAVDEIQLVEHPERGHIFTDRLLHARGSEETLFLGAETARSIIHALLGDEVRFDRRERFSTLSHVGPMRLSRLPKRSVIVAFSASEVYAIAELIRRYRGGAAVVMGALSPRTRNAQAELYQSGEVDFLIATDAVGMGLNLDADHVAFASLRKFDGRRKRYLSHMEAGQIAGRAGRFRNDGTFGTTADAPEMDERMVEAIEGHRFEPIGRAQWRNSDLDFDTLDALRDSLHARSPHRRLRRVAPAVDELSLERLATLPEVLDRLHAPRDVRRLWEICGVPDFRGLTIDAHVRLLSELHDQLVAHRGRIPHDWMEKRVSRLDETTGGVDILSQRLAQIRTWTYCANKPEWMFDAGHWQTRTRAVEDRLSDALHESLIARFVDRRTSALLKGIGANSQMTATVKDSGEVWVDSDDGGHMIGHLEGLSFRLDSSGSELEAKALSAAAAKAVGPEIDRRLTSMAGANHAVFTLSDAGEILWGGMVVGRIAKSGSVFNPDAEIAGGEYGNPQLVAMATERMRDYLRGQVEEHLGPLRALRSLTEDPAVPAPARGLAYQMTEHHGSLPRERFAADIRALGRDERSSLWEVGTVFGQYDVFLREMTKPKPSRLLSLLLAFGAGGDRKPFVPVAGMASVEDPDGEIARSHSTAAIRHAGYRVCGPRIVRFDILERLSRLIRQAQTEAGGPQQGFQIMQQMMALLGCGYEDMRGILRSLGYAPEEREVEEPPAEEPVQEPAATAEDVTPTVEPPQDAPSEPPPAADGPTSEATPNTAPDAAPAETTTGDTASALPADAPTADAPAPKPRKRREPVKLDVHHVRELLEDGTTVEHRNTEFWVWQRQPHNARRRQGGAPSHRKGGQSQKGQGQKGRGRGRGKGRPDRALREQGYGKGRDRNRGKGQSAGKRGRGAGGRPSAAQVESSPFAALAGLNLGKDGKSGDAKAETDAPQSLEPDASKPDGNASS